MGRCRSKGRTVRSILPRVSPSDGIRANLRSTASRTSGEAVASFDQREGDVIVRQRWDHQGGEQSEDRRRRGAQAEVHPAGQGAKQAQ